MARYIVGATWSDAPHLAQSDLAAAEAAIPAYQRDARMRGIPQLGAGAIYPFPETDVRVKDFELPREWPRAWGMDTAMSGIVSAVWAAHDRETQTVYIYSIYRRSQAETAVHAEAMRARGSWIPGVGDCAAIADPDRNSFLDKYKKFTLDLELPDKGVETGIQDVYDRLSSGKLKVFASCQQWFEEFRVYRRDERGRVVKKNDHLMDSTRYLIRSGLRRAKVAPMPVAATALIYDMGSHGQGWMR